jgi:hypothetical protein
MECKEAMGKPDVAKWREVLKEEHVSLILHKGNKNLKRLISQLIPRK